MPIKNLPFKLTDTHTTPTGMSPGEEWETFDATNQCHQVWIYVKNGEAATAFAQGDIVARKTGTVAATGVLAPVDSYAERVMGVAQHAIAAGSYGLILRKGWGEVLADTGGVSADTPIVVGNAVAGRADDVAAGAAAERGAIGYSSEAVAATAKATCWIECRG